MFGHNSCCCKELWILIEYVRSRSERGRDNLCVLWMAIHLSIVPSYIYMGLYSFPWPTDPEELWAFHLQKDPYLSWISHRLDKAPGKYAPGIYSQRSALQPIVGLRTASSMRCELCGGMPSEGDLMKMLNTHIWGNLIQNSLRKTQEKPSHTASKSQGIKMALHTLPCFEPSHKTDGAVRKNCAY